MCRKAEQYLDMIRDQGFEFESQNVQVLRSAFLHVHRVAEQPANHPGVDIGFGGFGKQQIAARLEHPIKLGQAAPGAHRGR